MNAKIDESGYLLIARPTRLNPQYCPYNPDPETDRHCGDWCPLFGEPEYFGDKLFIILACGRPNLEFAATDFVDERAK